MDGNRSGPTKRDSVPVMIFIKYYQNMPGSRSGTLAFADFKAEILYGHIWAPCALRTFLHLLAGVTRLAQCPGVICSHRATPMLTMGSDSVGAPFAPLRLFS